MNAAAPRSMLSLKALLRGYLLFSVNGRKYFSYAAAKAAKDTVPDHVPVVFGGWHLFLGWRGFYIRMAHPAALRPWSAEL